MLKHPRFPSGNPNYDSISIAASLFPASFIKQMASGNQAARLDGKDKLLEVRPAAMPKPGADEVVVKVHSVAINPVGWKMQEGFQLDQLELPFIMGTDVAGEIYEVGSSVKNFKKGDRVLA